jgi:predicted kinase
MKEIIKKMLKEGLNLNSLNIPVTKPNQILVIMRGISGSGKSTKAKQLAEGGVIHSTDNLIESTGDYRGFFSKMINENNFGNLSRMHRKNLDNAKKSMNEGISPVVIDNTNIKPNEAKPYVVHALNMGYDDRNIRIVDIGTGGATAEQLAERNTHGVPLDKIKSVIASHKSVGELTLKKILESKDMFKESGISYTGVVLDEESKSKLLSAFGQYIPDGWNKIAHHMTITFGKGLENKDELGKTVELTTQKIGVSDMAIAVEVDGYESKNKIPHITLAINPDGGKPVMSNDITDWKTTDKIKVFGIVTEVKGD